MGLRRGGPVLPTFCLFAAGGFLGPRPATRLIREAPLAFGSAPPAGAPEAAGGVEAGNEYLSGVASITSMARQSSSLLSPSDKIWTGGGTGVLPRY